MKRRPAPHRLRIMYRGRVLGDRFPPLWSHGAQTEGVTFATTDPYVASEYDAKVHRLELSGEARVLFQGTKQFDRIVGDGDPVEIALEARRLGYDAVWFEDQEDIGVAILNPKLIVTKSWISIDRDSMQ